MKKSIQALSNIYSEDLWLEISHSSLEQAKPLDHDYSNETGRNYAYINRLCLNVFLKWIEENIGLEVNSNVFAHEKVLPSIWEVVNGCAIAVGNKYLVLVPSDALDTEDFAVPQEWVDIPNWAADYYLPVQVDFEDQYLYIWGFVSRRTLKSKGDYDSISRIYYVERDHVIANLDVLWAACHLCPDQKGEVAPLPALSNREAEDLIEQLSKPSPYSPRLEVKFEQWGALLNESNWLLKLSERRQRLSVLPDLVQHPMESLVQNRLVQLSRWFDGMIEDGWQTVEELFSTKTVETAFRSPSVRGIDLDTREKVRRELEQFCSSQKEVALSAHMEDEDALVSLLQTTHNETIRWQAAEYLWTINPHHPDNAIRRVMDLDVQHLGHPVALMVGVLCKPTQKVAVLLRVYSMDTENQLPPDLRLIGLNEKGAPIPKLEAIARSKPRDQDIQLYFSADVGDRFSVRVTLEGAAITKHFLV